MNKIHIIGAGLAGCEAAWQASQMGLSVRLYEMKPKKKSPAHASDLFAELVCSNSFGSNRLANAAGLLKEEMRRLGSVVMEAADSTSVPAGGALAVDRKAFSAYVTQKILRQKNIVIVQEEISDFARFNGDPLIAAAGPLASEPFLSAVSELTGSGALHFFDASAPIVAAESIDMQKVFIGSRYGRGDDYLNCPMTKEEYTAFVQAINAAECTEVRGFEGDVFEGCMPIEVMAGRGDKTLLFGPMKPKGLKDPKTGREPFAVVQLRQEDSRGTMYNIVGFQTHLKWGEQRRVFSMIPGLERAEFLRFGVMHKNAYIQSPVLLNRRYRMRENKNIWFAGQITGVEGYMESASSGLLSGIYAASSALGRELPELSQATAMGALAAHVSNSSVTNFQPININYGIMLSCSQKIREREKRNICVAQRALEEIECFREQQSLLCARTENAQ